MSIYLSFPIFLLGLSLSLSLYEQTRLRTLKRTETDQTYVWRRRTYVIVNAHNHVHCNYARFLSFSTRCAYSQSHRKHHVADTLLENAIFDSTLAYIGCILYTSVPWYISQTHAALRTILGWFNFLVASAIMLLFSFLFVWPWVCACACECACACVCVNYSRLMSFSRCFCHIVSLLFSLNSLEPIDNISLPRSAK